MKLEGVELRRIAMPLVAPFRTSFGTQLTKDALLLRVVTSEGEGWGECVSMPEPLYAAEYLEASLDVMRRFLIPTLFGVADLDAEAVLPSLAHFHGYRMAKGALEMAVLDAQLRARGVSLGSALGATRQRVACGVSVGIMESVSQLMDVLARYIEEDRYARIKLKIEPGWDVEPVRATRERFGDELLLQVDANAAYSLQDAPRLAELDPFGLLLIEQPLEEDDILGHAELARQIGTPVCLDESITSVRGAITAIELGACAIVNIKAGRVGGYLEAKRIHDACVAREVPVWCGGMVETGLGRAANVALSALPGFALPGDTSGSDRFFSMDITEPFVLDDGHLTVPTGPGLGVTPLPGRLAEVTVATEWITA